MKYLRAFIIIGGFFTAVGLILVAGVLMFAKIQGPPPLSVPQSSLYYANDGSVIGESNNGQKRYWVRYENISPYLRDATIAIEDKNFYEHHGFDFKRIAGAALADVKAMSKVEGASTISQQYARNLYLTRDKTWNRKLTEAFYTLRLEMNYSKNKILEGYLNTIYYGHGAYGVEAASRYYFNKDAKDLTLGESAMLAGIPKGPSIYSPFISFDKAKKRQAIILQTMNKLGYITKSQLHAAAQEHLQFYGKFPAQHAAIAPYFNDVVKHELKTKVGLDERTIELGGLRVYTTLDKKQQQIAEEVMKETISDQSDIQLGFVAMDPTNGYVTALIGGRDYEKSPYNRAVQAVRQPGSTMKPLLYYAALQKGFTPSTTMRSEVTTFRFDDGRPDYTPHNFNNNYANDEITLAQALALSDNVFAVKTNIFLGEGTLVDTAKQFGITTKLAKVPSLALGTSGVRVDEMVGAYSMISNGGKKVEPTFITRVEDYKGNVIYSDEQAHDQVLEKDTDFVLSQMMTGMFDPKLNDYASVTGTSIISQMSRPYAGKSGTTDSDSWMIGFAPQLTAGVWTGYDKGNPITLTADKLYAKNIWIRFMERALKDEPIQAFKPPKGVVAVQVDPDNGKLATKDCPVSRLTYFKEGTEPTEYCDVHTGKPIEEKHQHKPAPKKKKPWYKRIFPW
ncbi:transglycosylase domain-containing protein [Falsibacillus albus]|uniref:Penicillin-binding protein n=1 Tax=Falsibacillus albus TaxID=2478915 RepID=A0A3L7JSZ9_9BACI|nr:transglycosylase domain-containing protein [Falsibacillus albus]RLQ93464.1 penicillin-binding protein [Falsibacillus albus]